MWRPATKYCSIFIASLIFLFIACFPSWPQQAENLATPQASSDNPVKDTSKEYNAGVQVGDTVGKKIDSFSDKASNYMGHWITAKAFSDITWLKLITCFLLLLVVLLIERIVRLTIDHRREKASKTGQNVKYIVIDAVAQPASLFIFVYGIYIVLTPILVHFKNPDGTNLVNDIAQKAVNLGVVVAIIWFIFKIVSILDFQLKKWASSTESTIDDVLAPLVGKALRIFIVIIGSILIIQNLTGVKIGPLIASLGIGGIAIALAAKDSIANLFGTLTILLDKPYQVGERVIIDKYDGVIEDVGFRSTRLRTLTGHLVTIPNEKIVSSGLENVGKRPHIRWLTDITITYDTPPDKVEKAVSIIKEILDEHEGMHPDFPPRVYFNGFNDWSLNIMVIAWYHPADYWGMQSWLQKTCLEILRRFNGEDIDFAFPSRTLYLANDDKRQLKLSMLKGETVTYIPE